ncbi:DUF736 domain-containing protein [Gluconacetobacter azotocaptans]|uniref:DUF736 domain-containing protein n=1 Tax=Gluconacetobacter azotocaptans TaxID=142834 RepID=UPI00195DC6AB|nr:DUF736 domain-containing protein [Gluconacetobacter azotocaptans]MBM9400806.1 DUF736 domain-containing protein [Gluconacetobacter azotocaptans]
MATIGSFKKAGEGFEGEIVTLALQARNVRLVPETNRTNDNAPSYRVYLGRVELGGAWVRRSNEGRNYLSLKLDDPSFAAPIFANLFAEDDGESHTLIWTRPRTSRNGD